MAQGQENPGTLARSLISMMRPVNWMKGVISTEKGENMHMHMLIHKQSGSLEFDPEGFIST